MSRSKNYYQGINLGRVQRSEYDDAKMRDLARHDARLGENLKTVERAKNVMKKSMEADKQMFMKTGSPATSKTFLPLQGAYARPGVRTISQHAKLGSDPRVKRFSVTERPSISDLDSTIPTRRRSEPRPTSYHEQSTDLAQPGAAVNNELWPVNEKRIDPNISHLESAKTGLHFQPETTTSPGTLDRLRQFDDYLPVETDRRGLISINRTTAYGSKYEKTSSKTESQVVPDGRLQPKESSGGMGSDVDKKSNDTTIENDEDVKDKRSEQGAAQDQDFKAEKRPTLWDTLSTPKYTSKTRSKRSQIELEFITSRMKGSKSSPAIFSAAKVKGQGKPNVPGSGGFQGQVGVLKVKQSASGRVRDHV